MRLTQVAKTSPLQHSLCKQCRRQVKPGQWVAYHRNTLGDAPAYESYFVLHIVCMDKLVSKAGVDDDVQAIDAAFEEKRRGILETGTLWAKTSN